MKKLFFIVFLLFTYGCGDGIDEKLLTETDKNGKVIFHKEKGELTLKMDFKK